MLLINKYLDTEKEKEERLREINVQNAATGSGTGTGTNDDRTEEPDSDGAPESENDFDGFKNAKINIIEWRYAQLFCKKKKTQDLPESGPSGSGVDIQTLTRLKIQAEIDMYNNVPTLDLKGNPLDWWKKNGVLFSGLSEMAKKILSCPPSSVESERLFSIGGNILTDKRSRLKAENSEMLMFLNYNLRLLPELQYF